MRTIKTVGKKVVLLFLLIHMGVAGFVTPASADSWGRTIVIDGILGWDSIKAGESYKEPKTVSEVMRLDPQPAHRTGYSAIIQECVDIGDKRYRWEVWDDFNSRDSWRPHAINEYPSYTSEIIRRFGTEIYDKAVKSGIPLMYENGTRHTIYSYTGPDHVPCNEDRLGQLNYSYGNNDFYLTMTFTEPPFTSECEEGKCPPPPPSVDEGCKINCGDTPQDNVCIEGEWLIENTIDEKVYEIRKCEEIKNPTEGKTDGYVMWRLYKPDSTKISQEKAGNWLRMHSGVNHFEERNEKWLTTGVGITPKERTFCLILNRGYNFKDDRDFFIREVFLCLLKLF